jgi:hypothetical protein
MTLRSSLLRELDNPNLSVNSRAELFCELARDLENRGEYEEARQVLRDYWQGIGESPKLSGLEQSVAGEVLLRAGVLTGYLGSKYQIEEAQERVAETCKREFRLPGPRSQHLSGSGKCVVLDPDARVLRHTD